MGNCGAVVEVRSRIKNDYIMERNVSINVLISHQYVFLRLNLNELTNALQYLIQVGMNCKSVCMLRM